MPGPTERRLLTLALNVMLAVAILAAGVLAWRFAGVAVCWRAAARWPAWRARGAPAARQLRLGQRAR